MLSCCPEGRVSVKDHSSNGTFLDGYAIGRDFVVDDLSPDSVVSLVHASTAERGTDGGDAAQMLPFFTLERWRPTEDMAALDAQQPVAAHNEVASGATSSDGRPALAALALAPSTAAPSEVTGPPIAPPPLPPPRLALAGSPAGSPRPGKRKHACPSLARDAMVSDSAASPAEFVTPPDGEHEPSPRDSRVSQMRSRLRDWSQPADGCGEWCPAQLGNRMGGAAPPLALLVDATPREAEPAAAAADLAAASAAPTPCLTVQLPGAEDSSLLSSPCASAAVPSQPSRPAPPQQEEPEVQQPPPPEAAGFAEPAEAAQLSVDAGAPCSAVRPALPPAACGGGGASGGEPTQGQARRRRVSWAADETLCDVHLFEAQSSDTDEEYEEWSARFRRERRGRAAARLGRKGSPPTGSHGVPGAVLAGALAGGDELCCLEAMDEDGAITRPPHQHPAAVAGGDGGFEPADADDLSPTPAPAEPGEPGAAAPAGRPTSRHVGAPLSRLDKVRGASRARGGGGGTKRESHSASSSSRGHLLYKRGITKLLVSAKEAGPPSPSSLPCESMQS